MRTLTIALLAFACLAGAAQAQYYPSQREIDQMRRPPPQANERYREWLNRRESPMKRIKREDTYRQRLGPCALYGTCPVPPPQPRHRY